MNVKSSSAPGEADDELVRPRAILAPELRHAIRAHGVKYPALLHAPASIPLLAPVVTQRLCNIAASLSSPSDEHRQVINSSTCSAPSPSLSNLAKISYQFLRLLKRRFRCMAFLAERQDRRQLVHAQRPPSLFKSNTLNAARRFRLSSVNSLMTPRKAYPASTDCCTRAGERSSFFL